VIQFQVSQNVNHDDFLASVKLLVPNVETTFFIDNYQGIIIERHQASHFTLAEFSAIFQALGADFSVEIKLYIGLFYEKETFQGIFYQAEKKQFNQLKQHANHEVIAVTCSDYFLTHLVDKDSVLTYLNDCLKKDNELCELIIVLFESGNSLRLASQKLFIHRNTLQYKLKKFQEDFGFSIKNLKELTMCYLLLVNS
jgi:DNA-binding PucR family transcriptional regulator